MAVFAQYEFSGDGNALADEAVSDGSQNGVLLNGAVQSGGCLLLDGVNDHAVIAASPDFQLPQGTIAIDFIQSAHTGDGTDTILSRDSAGQDNSGQFSLGVTAAGSVTVCHNTATTHHSFSTPAGFAGSDDMINVIYSWDASGKGGAFIATNSASGATYSEPISAALTMDMGPDDNEPWVIGASAEKADDGQENHLTEFFQGSVSHFSISNSVDTPDLDGIVEGTDGDDLIDLDYTGDPEGDRIDHRDAILPGAGPNDDYVLAGDGNDTVVGGRGRDNIFGEEGDDLLFGGYNGDTIDGGAGDDTLLGGFGPDALFGGDGNDLLDAGGRADPDEDYLDGGAGDDTLTGSGGADTLLGGDDRDVFTATSAGSFIDGGEGGIDFDTLDLSDWGAAATNIIYDPTNPENGIVEFLDQYGNIVGTLTFQNIENVVPCFTPGIVIATPKGERAVEELVAGDKIITRDNGIQEIRWVGANKLSYGQLVGNSHLKPILITKGSLGDDLPERDMMVSPNHRLLVANERTALYFEEHEVLVSAKHLVDNHTIREVESLGTTYIHFMCDRHEVVLANGLWTESFQPGDYSLNGLGNAQRGEIYELFPELQTGEGRQKYQAARKTLKRREAKLLRFRN
ncbi:MAG: Hint domain-containing protein [Paracoccaceae bacterium]|nr:Hint domain-containing protein [Paracoccaceae bacterium]